MALVTQVACGYTAIPSNPIAWLGFNNGQGTEYENLDQTVQTRN